VPNEPESSPPDFKAFTETLNRHGVEYVMIGGVAALLHGSSRVTFDLDLLARGSLENLDRLADALKALGAASDIDSAHLRGFSTRWETDVGRVDVLLSARGLDGKMSISYGDVAERRVDIVHDGTTIPVVGFNDLIEMKTAVGRPHDLETVHELLDIRSRNPAGIDSILSDWETRRTDAGLEQRQPGLDHDL
jgi:predicted nucleotidyltransferase